MVDPVLAFPFFLWGVKGTGNFNIKSLMHYFITNVGKFMLSGYDVFMNFSVGNLKELNTAPSYACSFILTKKEHCAHQDVLKMIIVYKWNMFQAKSTFDPDHRWTG